MRKLLIVLLLIASILALPLFAMRSERALLFLAHWAVDSFTDFRLVLRKPKLRPLQGFASAAEIHLYPQADDAPPLLSVLDFSSELSPADLYAANLRQSSLYAGQVVIYTSDRGSSAEPAPMEWLQYLSWLPKTLDIGQLHVVRATRNVAIIRLKELVGHRQPGSAFLLTASAQYEGEPLAIQVELSAGRDERMFSSLAMHATATAQDSNSRVVLNGELRGTSEDFDYDLDLDADYTEIGLFLKGMNARRDLEGTLKVTAQMRGDTRGFTLSNAEFVLDNMPDYGIEAAGNLQYLGHGKSILNLVAAGEIDTTNPLLTRLPLDLRPLGRAQGSARITGSLAQPVVEKFLLVSENADGLVVKIMGRLEQDAQHNRVEVDLHGPQLSALSHWTGPLPHEAGPFQASGVLSGQMGAVALGDLIIEAGSRKQVLLRIEGSAQSTGLTEELGLAAIKQAKLDLSIDSPDSTFLSPYLDIEVPGGFEVSGKLQLQGSGDSLAVSGGKLQAISSDITVTATPKAGLLEPSKSPLVSDVKSDVFIEISDTSALSQFVTFPVPVLGAVEGRGTLSQYEQRIALEEIQLELKRADSQLSMTGTIADITTLQGTQLHSRFAGIEVHSLLMTMLNDFNYAGQLGTLEGGFQLQQDSDGWALDSLTLGTADQDGPLLLESHGRIGNLMAVPALNLTTTFSLRDPDLLEALGGLRMNPVNGEVTLRSSEGSTDFSSRGRVGDTELTLAGQLQHTRDAIEKLTARLASPMVHLDDLGLQAKQSSSTQYNPSEKIQLKPMQRLEVALQRAPRYKTDIEIDLTGISGENTRIKSFDVHYTGEQQRYTLRRFTVAYDESITEVRGIIDLNSKPPFVSLAGEISALPLSTLTRDLGIDFDVSGTAYLRGGISSQGASAEALLDDLDGNVALALENAEIEGAAYDVLATDLLAWFYSGAALEKSTHVDCTMASFVLNDGIATSDSLYIETSKMVATGDAMLNLGKQKMDIRFTPRSKSRSLQVPSSIRLKGSFSDPSVTLSPVAAAFDAYAEVLTLVPRIAGKIFGVKKRSKASQPCKTAQ